MAKTRTQFVCQNCGRITAAFVGKCPQCGQFGTMVEQMVATSTGSRGGKSTAPGRYTTAPIKLKDVKHDGLVRKTLTNKEFGRVLGGGIVPGSLVLIGGDPGIGKSTILLHQPVYVNFDTC